MGGAQAKGDRLGEPARQESGHGDGGELGRTKKYLGPIMEDLAQARVFPFPFILDLFSFPN